MVAKIVGNAIAGIVNMAERLKEKFGNFIAGCDLAVHNFVGNAFEMVANKLKSVANKIGLFFHGREQKGQDTRGDTNLLDAILLGVNRIGHAFSLIRHPKIMEIVSANNIAVEICPIASQVLGLVQDMRDHAASILFKSPFNVIISNSNPGLWGVKGLSHDFYQAFMGMMSPQTDLRALKTLAKNSLSKSSCSPEERVDLLTAWSRQWFQFVNKLTSGELLG